MGFDASPLLTSLSSSTHSGPASHLHPHSLCSSLAKKNAPFNLSLPVPGPLGEVKEHRGRGGQQAGWAGHRPRLSSPHRCHEMPLNPDPGGPSLSRISGERDSAVRPPFQGQTRLLAGEGSRPLASRLCLVPSSLCGGQAGAGGPAAASRGQTSEKRLYSGCAPPPGSLPQPPLLTRRDQTLGIWVFLLPQRTFFFFSLRSNRQKSK